MTYARMPLAEFELPFPPTVNHYWKKRGKHHFISEKGQAFRSNVLARVVEVLGRFPDATCEPLALEIELHPPDKIRRDADNFLKAPLDALAKAGVYQDDVQIKRLTVEMFPSAGKPGRAVVRLYEYHATVEAGRRVEADGVLAMPEERAVCYRDWVWECPRCSTVRPFSEGCYNSDGAPDGEVHCHRCMESFVVDAIPDERS